MGRKPINKRRKKAPHTKAQWVETLMPIYLEHGIKKFTMDEISQQINISKATLYKHFSSRLEILDEVVDRKIKEITAFKFILEDESIPYEERYFEAAKAATLELAGISNLFLSDIKHSYPKLWEKFSNLFGEAEDVVLEFYKKGLDLGILSDIDPIFMATTDKVFISAMANPKFLDKNKLTLQKAVEGYFKMKSKAIFRKV